MGGMGLFSSFPENLWDPVTFCSKQKMVYSEDFLVAGNLTWGSVDLESHEM